MKIPYVLNFLKAHTEKTEDTPKSSQQINSVVHERSKRLFKYDCIELQDMMYETEKKFFPDLLDDIEVI